MNSSDDNWQRHPIWNVIAAIASVLAVVFAIFVWFVPNSGYLSHQTNPSPISTNFSETPTPSPTPTTVVQIPSPTTPSSSSSVSLVDILFLITVSLLAFNGLRNGFIFSLINLFSLPFASVVAWLFGPMLTAVMTANDWSATPMIFYMLLFFAAVLIVHIVVMFLRSLMRRIPLIGMADSLLGGVVGFVEAWLLWVTVLLILHNFLQDINQTHIVQISHWRDFYNFTVANSLFARVNGFIIQLLP